MRKKEKNNRDDEEKRRVRRRERKGIIRRWHPTFLVSYPRTSTLFFLVNKDSKFVQG